jgi:hypothetical protein
MSARVLVVRGNSNEESILSIMKIQLVIICHLSLVLLYCGLDIEDPTPISPPLWVQKSLPNEWPEQGIDAHESGGIVLEWEHSDGEDVYWYIIYRAEKSSTNDSLSDYERLNRIEAIANINSNGHIEYLDIDVVILTKYFYKIKAENISGKYGSSSISLNYTLLPRIDSHTMIPNGVLNSLDSDRRLSWNYENEIDMENYCLTILNDTNELILREVLTPIGYIGQRESWVIPNPVELKSDKIYKWRIDMGGVYVDELESMGSESKWAIFLFLD